MKSAAVAVKAAIRRITAFSMISFFFFEMHSLDEFVYKGLFFNVDKIILMTTGLYTQQFLPHL